MDLLKQISEEIHAYYDSVHALVEKIEAIEVELTKEKRLGLRETAYYQNDNAHAAGKPETVDFQPQSNVAKPTQQPSGGPEKGLGGNKMQGRIQLMYNPASGRVEDAKQAQGMNQPPAPGYVPANAQQLQDALKHIEQIDKTLADKIVAGNVQVFIPQKAEAPRQTPNVTTHGGMNRMEMDPSQLANAKAAADKMSLA